MLREELPDSPERMLCAMINNNATCYDECEDFADRLEELLEDPFKVRVFVQNRQLERLKPTFQRCFLPQTSKSM